MLRDYQTAAIKALWSLWREKPFSVPLIVAPTGSGKTKILAEICRLVLGKKPDFKIFVVTHRKELIEQNAIELSEQLKIPIGIYSAGLGQKKIRKVTCAGVQSIYKKKVEADLIIVDEAHLISSNDDSMYQKLIKTFKDANPNVRFCGLTATAYRMDQGSLLGGFFTDIAYDIDVGRLVADGYLSKLVSKPKGNIDFSNVERSGFDYKQSALEETMHPYVAEHCVEILAAAHDRKSILIFCSGVNHAKEISEEFNRLNEKSEYIHGEMISMQRDQILRRFKNGETRILANCDILTTGFNYPSLECIVLLRATRSTGLYVQIVGRGMRCAPNKKNCLILDFGGNVERHGPIDCVRVKIEKDKKVKVKKAPTKTCPECGAVWNIKTIECACGHVFSRESCIEPIATTLPVMNEPEILDVDSVVKKIHRKEGSPLILRIDYVCGIRTISEFLCLEHHGYAQIKAREKWARLGGSPARTCEEALYQDTKTPKQIQVIKEGKWFRVQKILGFQDPKPDYFEELGVNI